MADPESRLKLLEAEIERRLVERFAALRDEFDRLRLESDRRWAGFLDRFEQKFSGIVPPELMSEPEPAPPLPPAAATLDFEAVLALDDASNQVEALHRFLDFCRHYASRVALFVARGGTIGVWKAVGFSELGGSDDAARKVTPPAAPGSLLAQVMEGQPCELLPSNEISASLSAEDVARAVLIPIVVKEKISGALYADCVASEQSRFDPKALAFLTFLAGLIVDRLAGRKLKPAPALRALETLSSAPPPPPPPEGAPEPEFELAEEAPQPAPEPDAYATPTTQPPETPPPSPSKLPPPPQFYGPPAVEEGEEEPHRPTPPSFERLPRETGDLTPPRGISSLELGAAPAELSSPAGTVRIPTSMFEAPAAAPTPGPVPKPVVPGPPPLAPSASRPRASTVGRRLGGPLAPVEGDERTEEARRFAKLLVSEIKLYNEKAVARGREQGNIYELLKEDIERTRQMYDERIPEDIRAGSNFFYEELVRILADGRADALGI